MIRFGVLGAGGQAREVADFASAGRPAFFAVDSNHVASVASRHGVPVLDIGAADSTDYAVPVVAAVGAPGLRRELLERWRGSAYARAVSAHAYVASDVVVGQGTMIAPGAVIMAGATLGRHVLINAGVTVGHDTVLEDFATLSPGVNVGGHCVIEQGAFVGIGASLHQGVRIGEGAMVGAGGAVVENLESLAVFVGVPARRIRKTEGWLHEL